MCKTRIFFKFGVGNNCIFQKEYTPLYLLVCLWIESYYIIGSYMLWFLFDRCGILFFMFLLSTCTCLWRYRFLSGNTVIIKGYPYTPLPDAEVIFSIVIHFNCNNDCVYSIVQIGSAVNNLLLKCSIDHTFSTFILKTCVWRHRFMSFLFHRIVFSMDAQSF